MMVMTDFYKSVLSSFEVDSYTTADMTQVDKSMHWLDQLMQDVQEPGSAWKRRDQRDGFQSNDNHHDVALAWDSSYS